MPFEFQKFRTNHFCGSVSIHAFFLGRSFEFWNYIVHWTVLFQELKRIFTLLTGQDHRKLITPVVEFVSRWCLLASVVTFLERFSVIVLSITMWTTGIDWRLLPSALAVQLVEAVAEVLYLASAENASHTHQLTLLATAWPSEDMPTLPEMSLSVAVLIGRCVGLSRRGSFMQEGPPDRTALSCPGIWSYWRNSEGFLGDTTSWFWKLPRLTWKTQSGGRKRNNLVDHQWSTCMHWPNLFKDIIQTFTLKLS